MMDLPENRMNTMVRSIVPFIQGDAGHKIQNCSPLLLKPTPLALTYSGEHEDSPCNDHPLDSGDSTNSDSANNNRSPYDYAEAFFFGFLATTRLYDLLQCSAVQFVGLPRVGKSSAVSVQCGANLSLGKTDGGLSTFMHRHRKGDPKISHSTVAKTVNVSVFCDFRGRRNIIDTPGLNDNRAQAYKLWSNFSLETSYALTESIEATCVVIHFQSSFAPGANADSFRDLAVALLASAGGEGCEERRAFLNNLCFMFTHVPVGTSVEGIVRQLCEVHISYLLEQVNILENLSRRYPSADDSSPRSRVMNMAHRGMGAIGGIAAALNFKNPQVQASQGKIDRLRCQISWENETLPTDPQMITLERLNASVVLLEAIISSQKEQRIVISNPDGHWRCERQRFELEEAFRSCRPLDRQVLRKLAVCRRLPSYEVYEILEHMARQMGGTLDRFNAAMSTFLGSVHKYDQVIQAISDDWRAYREEYVAELRLKKRGRQGDVKNAEAEIARLKSSRNLIAPPRNIYSAVKMKNDWMEWLGLSLTRTTISHVGPYEEIQINGKYGSYDVQEDRDASKVTIVVCSKVFESVDARVLFTRHECDLDETKGRIRDHESSIQIFNAEIQRIDETLRSSAAVNSAKSLTSIVVTAKIQAEVEDVTRSCQALSNAVATSIFDGDQTEKTEMTVEYREACFGLYRLLKSLQQEHAIPQVMKHTQWESTTTSFVESFCEYEKLVAEYTGSLSAAKLVSEFDVVLKPSSSRLDVHEESSGQSEAAFRRVLETLSVLRAKAEPVAHVLIEDHPTAVLISCGLALLSIGLKLSPCTSLAIFMVFLGLLLSVSQGLYKMRRLFTDEMHYVKRELEHRLDGLEISVGAEVGRQIDDTRQSLLQMLEERIAANDNQFSMNTLLWHVSKAVWAFFL